MEIPIQDDVYIELIIPFQIINTWSQNFETC
jgi:hypothetical protein